MWAPYCDIYAPINENACVNESETKRENVENKRFEFVEYKKIEFVENKK